MLKPTKIIISIMAMIGMFSSCTTTMPATSKAKMDQTVNEVKLDMKQMGYFASGSSSEQRSIHDYGAIKNKSGAGHEDLGVNAVFNFDTYNFENSDGDKMEFSVQYMVKEGVTGVCLADVSTTGCKTSNVKDYEKLCGNDSPINKINVMPKDANVKVANPMGTFWLCLVIGVGMPLIPLLILL